jgi:hypothetical protein
MLEKRVFKSNHSVSTILPASFNIISGEPQPGATIFPGERGATIFPGERGATIFPGNGATTRVCPYDNPCISSKIPCDEIPVPLRPYKPSAYTHNQKKLLMITLNGRLIIEKIQEKL